MVRLLSIQPIEPLTDQFHDTDWVEPDDVPRLVVTYGFASETFGEFELEPHHHKKSQILLVQRAR